MTVFEPEWADETPDEPPKPVAPVMAEPAAICLDDEPDVPDWMKDNAPGWRPL